MANLYVVRHGETDFNIEGRYQGSMDVELNNKGLQQARGIVNEVSVLKVDVVITSPLKRCRCMAEMIYESINIPIIEMSEFRERSAGIFEGLTREEAKVKYPDLWSRNINRIYNDAPPKGETIKEVEDRVFAGLEKIKKEYQQNNILIITHAFAGKLIHKYFNDLSLEEFFAFNMENAKIISYQLD